MTEVQRQAVKRKTTRPRGYIDNYRPQAKTRELLHHVIGVLDDYRDHWPMTPRQILYVLMGRIGYPKLGYDRLCENIANARRGRVIPFEAIRDDGISVCEPDHYPDMDAFFADCRRRGERYVKDKLDTQKYYIEVWCEAAGMVPQLARVAHQYSIAVYSTSGFDSLAAKKECADRICAKGYAAVILHLGDWDTAGEHIFTALAEDVRAFVVADKPWATMDVQFRRVSLTAEQVDEYHLPTLEAKGRRTCQLEALAADQLAAILDGAISGLFNQTMYARDLELERWERQQIAHALPAGGAP